MAPIEIKPGKCQGQCSSVSNYASGFQTTADRVAAHPSLKQTGATVHWGIDDARELEGWAPGIRLEEEWYFSQAPEIAKLGTGYRLAFNLAGLFSAANKAQRIVYYTLGGG